MAAAKRGRVAEMSARIVVPNGKLASDTIRKASIRDRDAFAEMTLPVPLAADLGIAPGVRG